jgi:Trk K+ transport system NAD-binding subunit
VPTDQSDTSEWSGHVIVCGLHGVGLRIVEQLHLAGVQVVVVDDRPDPRLIRAVHTWGIPHVTGSARFRESLIEAGLTNASAVICVEDNDLASLETALLVSEIRPDVRVVVQLANTAVGRAVEAVTGTGSVLDVAALAAPSVVEACLSRTTKDVDLGGTGFVVAEIVAPTHSTLRVLYSDLVPIAVVDKETRLVTVCPGRDYLVNPGDRVSLLGTPEQLDDFGLDWRDPDVHIPLHANDGPLTAARRFIATVLTATDKQLRLAVVGVGVLVAIAIVVLMIGYHKADGSKMSFVDAVYFSIETVGTIGYGDFSFAEQSTWLRCFAIAFMLSGTISVAIFFAMLTNYLVSRRIESSLGRRLVTSMSGHVILIGLGSVGMRVLESLLANGKQVVVVERDEGNRYLDQARALGVPVLIGDATVSQTLDSANLDKASAVAVLTSNDLVNIESALAVRGHLKARAHELPLVVRLFDRQLAQFVEQHFDMRYVRSTSALAAPWFVGAALGLDVLSTFYVERQPFLVGRLHVAQGGGLDGLAMRDLSARTRVVAISRASAGGKLEYPPRRDTRFGPDDEAYMVGPYEDLLQVLRRDTLAPHQIIAAMSVTPAVSASTVEQASS